MDLHQSLDQLRDELRMMVLMNTEISGDFVLALPAPEPVSAPAPVSAPGTLPPGTASAWSRSAGPEIKVEPQDRWGEMEHDQEEEVHFIGEFGPGPRPESDSEYEDGEVEPPRQRPRTGAGPEPDPGGTPASLWCNTLAP
ncbi:hypothetical protein BSKO_01644 [Bryopsis sp. KO-2023]|nr:hypothetical protein BSKO_01644 [Bryopsis sp. KO-2023]